MAPIANILMRPVVTESALRDPELAGRYWTDTDLPVMGGVSLLLTPSDQPEDSVADMSEWPPELDAEARAIHRDFAAASFRTLLED